MANKIPPVTLRHRSHGVSPVKRTWEQHGMIVASRGLGGASFGHSQRIAVTSLGVLVSRRTGVSGVLVNELDHSAC